MSVRSTQVIALPRKLRESAAALTVAFGLVVPLLGSVPAMAAEPESSPESAAALIKSMSNALKTLNYEGTFVHMQGSNIRSMHILHSSNAKGELERMTSLDGEAREVVRNHKKVTCIFPGSEQVVVSKSKPRELLPSVDAALTRNESYELALGKIDRVAAREAQIVDIQPRDQYRYGYRLWVDTRTSMLLRYLLLDDRENAIEQVLFTDIQYPETIDPTRFHVDLDNSKVTWVDVEEQGDELSPSEEQPEAAKTADRVGFESLPEGYQEVVETYRAMPIETGPISHVMVSDGMASVSVYVEHVKQPEQDTSADGVSMMGAMNAFGKSLPNAYVTVVGEVPTATVKRIANAVLIR